MNWKAFRRGFLYFYSGQWLIPKKRYYSLSAKEARIADAKAMRGDWEAVGQYLRTAMEQFEQETGIKNGK